MFYICLSNKLDFSIDAEQMNHKKYPHVWSSHYMYKLAMHAKAELKPSSMTTKV